MGLNKRVYIDKETPITAENLNAIQDAVIDLEDGLFSIENNKSGEVITITDAAQRGFRSLSIFGKTTQDGTPTPDAPVELVNIGNSGIITVNVTGEDEERSMTIATPNGLPGIPVSSGGNYTDANGQQWICDEIDLARSVYIKRIEKRVFDGTEDGWYQHNNQPPHRIVWSGVNGGWDKKHAIASHFINDVKAYGAKAGYFVIDPSGLCYFASDKMTITDFRDWLSANNVTVVCPLITPIEERLSEDELAAYASLHTYKDNTTVSNDASAHMELEYVMDAKKYIDRLIGTGGGGGSSARLSNVTLLASAWKGTASPYSQVVTIDGITEYSKVDLLPSVEQMAIFHNKDLAFVTENEDGVVTVYAIGEKPTNDYTMQVSITEVVA